jgi:hypothetical protein
MPGNSASTRSRTALLARAAPVVAAAAAAEAGQVDHHVRVAAVEDLRDLEEVVEAVARPGCPFVVFGGLTRVVHVRADREDDGHLFAVGHSLRPQDVRV